MAIFNSKLLVYQGVLEGTQGKKHLSTTSKNSRSSLRDYPGKPIVGGVNAHEKRPFFAHKWEYQPK